MTIFKKFPELKVGIFGKPSELKEDAACARELGFAEVATLNQIHGNTTHIVEGPMDGSLEGDGLITKTPGLALSVRWADCQAFIVYAPLRQSSLLRHPGFGEQAGQAPKQVIGVLHAGWRGMALKAITAHFQCLQANFGIEPSETYVGATPSLCLQCAEFSDPLKELPEHLHPFIHGRNVDLQTAADAELESLGVPSSQRERHPACTRCGDGFWSWRRDKVPDA